MNRSIEIDKLTIGVCYYPEQWPKSMWEDDLKRMLANGITVIRIAEFTWIKFEPEESVFTFSFFDEFMSVVEKYPAMKVIFCTPTATPPAWMTEKYPEILPVTVDGQVIHHGMRRHYNYNSPKYRELSACICRKLAEHYCPHHSIIGWQLDNEFNGGGGPDSFYSESDHKAFRIFLKNKYGTLDKLNETWGTIFWDQTYTDWEQIYLTRYTSMRSPNPHLVLDEKRFFSQSAISYAKMQYDILKEYTPEGQFITTNGLFHHLDYNELVGTGVDFIGVNFYPNQGNNSNKIMTKRGFDDNSLPESPENLNDRKWSWILSNARACSSNFAILEQQSGANGWINRMPARSPRPGQMRLWTFQSIAHGADFINYFRWRTCTFGTEMYWHGILDYDNLPNRKLEELGRTYKDVSSVGDIAGSKFKAKVAIVRDYDNLWDGEFDIWHGPLRGESEVGWFNAAQRSHTPFDIVYMRKCSKAEDLTKYDLVVYPHATILTKETADILKEYVARGGTLIMGARTGYKDEYGHCYMMEMPCYAKDLCGIAINDYSMLCFKDFEQKAVWDDEEIDAIVFNDILRPVSESVEVLAIYKGNYYDGKPALTVNSYGKGKAYYFGAGFNSKMADKMLRKLGFANPYGDVIDLPECCEIAIREKDGEEYIFVLNYSDNDELINIKKPLVNLFTGETLSGSLTLDKYGVLVLQEKSWIQ